MLRRIPRHSTIVAYAALFAALGGTATAATALKANSVGARQIQTAAVRSGEIKDRSVQTRDLAPPARPQTRGQVRALVESTMTSSEVLSALSTAVKGEPGPAGPAGPAGPQGTPGVQSVRVVEEAGGRGGPGAIAGATARCAAGEKALGGGGYFQANGAGAVVRTSGPLPDADGWTVTFQNGDSSPSGTAVAQVVCARVGS